MRAWIVFLLAALLVAPLVLVAVLLKGVVPKAPAAAPIVQARSEPLPPPAAPEAPVVDVRPEVARLLERLFQSIKDTDVEAESRIQSELQAIGFPAVEPMRTGLLALPELFYADYRFQKSVARTLMGLASPEVGLEMLKSWSEVDQSKYKIAILPAVFVLGQYAPVVVKRPAPNLAKRILEDFSQAKTRGIRLSLIELMGLLLARFPELRDALLKIMLEDEDNEVRGGAILALAADNPAAAMPAILKRMEALLSAAESSTSHANKELMCLLDFLVKALPFDQALDRLRELSDKSTGTYAVNLMNVLGFALGNKVGGPGSAEFEIYLSRAASEKSRNMQLVYMGTLMGVSLKSNPDSRATELALSYLDTSKDEWVRAHALSMITALNRDEATVLGAYEKAWKEGGQLAFSAAGQLKFYIDRNAKTEAAVEQLKSYLTMGSVETRLKVLEGLRWGGGKIPQSSLDQLKTMASSDPDPKIRDEAAKTLKWAGVPLQ